MYKFVFALSFVILSSCGGGSSSNPTQPTPIITPANVTLNLETDKNFLRVGDTLNIKWTTSNATSCNASGSWSGVRATSGSETFIVQTSGILEYFIECTNSSSSNKQSKKVVVPYAVYGTSYENKNEIAFDKTQVPTIRALGIKTELYEQDSNERSVTFGDFFQEGSISAFVVTSFHKNIYNVTDLPDSPSKAYFLSRNNNGKWIDRTNELIKIGDDRYNCVTVSYAITADFNNDKVPDVFLSCNGIDYTLNDGTNNINHPRFSEIYLENPMIYLSQPDKTFKKIVLPYRLYGHQAAAADINGDNAVDVILTNQASDSWRYPVVLMGNGDGTFYQNNTLIPNSLIDQNKNGLYQIQLIPMQGRLDLVLGFTDITYWIKGVQGSFDYSTVQKIEMPKNTKFNKQYEMPLDVIFHKNNFYFSTNINDDNKGTDWAIIEMDIVKLTFREIKTFYNPSWSNLQPYTAQLKLNNDKSFFVAYTGGCNADLKKGMCGLEIPY